jgi:hypothetical protein
MIKYLILFVSVSALGAIGWKGDNLTVGGISYEGEAVEITADDQVLAVGQKTHFKLSSDSPTGNQRTVLLSKPDKNNHLLVLSYEDEASDRINLDDGSAVQGSSGVLKLNNIWNPNAGDTITLLYADPDYLEIARSNN